MKPMAFALCLCACGKPATDATVDQLRAALPTGAALSMTPAATHAPATNTCAPLGPSEFGTLTHQIAGNADGVIGSVLGEVQQISNTPPQASAPGQAAWAIPSASGAAVYRLIVEETAPSQFNFNLAGKPLADSTWQDIFAGVTMTPDAAHRSGYITVDFGVMHAFDATTDPIAGGFQVHFDAAGSARDVNAQFSGITDHSAQQPNDGGYAFLLAADQSADLAFSTLIDWNGDGVLDEMAHIDSHWTPSGAGVAHLTTSGGNSASECWDSSLARLYFSDSLGHGEGDASCCP
jgi:hypothetical protein